MYSLLDSSQYLCLGCYFSVCGLGYGMISGAFSLINILADIAGPGTVGINGHDEHFVIVSGEHYDYFNVSHM